MKPGDLSKAMTMSVMEISGHLAWNAVAEIPNSLWDFKNTYTKNVFNIYLMLCKYIYIFMCLMQTPCNFLYTKLVHLKYVN